jgi:hypothetical protein
MTSVIRVSLLAFLSGVVGDTRIVELEDDATKVNPQVPLTVIRTPFASLLAPSTSIR